MSLRIRRIAIYRTLLPLHEGSYKWSGGKSVEAFDTTVVGIETQCGITGYGECCPLGSSYIPAFPEGTRAGIYMCTYTYICMYICIYRHVIIMKIVRYPITGA